MKDEIPFWVQFDGENIPSNAIIGGKYKGQKIFIGRSPHEGSLTVGMVLENEKILLLPWGCVSNQKDTFEILVSESGNSSGNWVSAMDGAVPLNSFPGGHSEYLNETTFIGRFKQNDCLVVGKVQPSHRVCYIAYEDKELSNRLYEVLVI